LALSASRAGWVGARQQPEEAEEISLDESNLSAAVGALRGYSSLAGRRVHVVLDDALVRLFVVPPAAGVRGLAELRALAAARFEDLFGLDSTGWTIRANWTVDEPFLACAMESILLHALRTALPSLRTCAPAISHSLEAAPFRGDLWVLQLIGGRATVVLRQAGAIRLVRSVISPKDLGAWLREQSLLVGQPFERTVVFGESNVQALEGITVTRGGSTRPLSLLAHVSRNVLAVRRDAAH
jgi:hypothetical protein